MAASQQQRYRQRRQAQGFKEVTVSLDTVSQERLRRLGQVHDKTRQEVVALALLAAERLPDGELIMVGLSELCLYPVGHLSKLKGELGPHNLASLR
jgi:hypothetical protein